MRYLVDRYSKTVEFQDEYNAFEIAKVMEIYSGYKFTTKLSFPMMEEQKGFGLQKGNDYQSIQGANKPC